MTQEADSAGRPGDRPAAPAEEGWLARLQRWTQRAGGLRSDSGPGRLPPSAADAAEATTQLPPGRGQALREAHRTLRQRLRSHAALRQVVPHLWYIERSLAKRGSAALQGLPVTVLQRGLQQLALLQHDDEPPREALQLRVLRLRLIEAIADHCVVAPVRPPEHWHHGADSRATCATLETLSSHPSGMSSLPGMEVSELPLSAFDDADPATSWRAPVDPAAAAPRMRR